MADARTLMTAANYDTCRRVAGLGDSLSLVKATATGYSAVGTVTEGWDVARKRDPQTGAQLLVVAIAETDTLTLAWFATTSAVVFDGRRYKVQVLERPTGIPKIWQLLCDPTGETV